MTGLTVFLYLPILIQGHGPTEINEGINYFADILLYAGAALALASALPRDPDRMGKRSVHVSKIESCETF
jgi:hypothetical protein